MIKHLPLALPNILPPSALIPIAILIPILPFSIPHAIFPHSFVLLIFQFVFIGTRAMSLIFVPLALVGIAIGEVVAAFSLFVSVLDCAMVFLAGGEEVGAWFVVEVILELANIDMSIGKIKHAKAIPHLPPHLAHIPRPILIIPLLITFSQFPIDIKFVSGLLHYLLVFFY